MQWTVSLQISAVGPSNWIATLETGYNSLRFEYVIVCLFHFVTFLLFSAMLESLCAHLYDIFRPLIIHINHLETLAELCAILKVCTPWKILHPCCCDCVTSLKPDSPQEVTRMQHADCFRSCATFRFTYSFEFPSVHPAFFEDRACHVLAPFPHFALVFLRHLLALQWMVWPPSRSLPALSANHTCQDFLRKTKPIACLENKLDDLRDCRL